MYECYGRHWPIVERVQDAFEERRTQRQTLRSLHLAN